MFAPASVSFDTLGLHPDVLSALSLFPHITAPTSVQHQAIPFLLDDSETDMVVAAETGSGKTLAYLLPLIHSLVVRDEVKASPPRALILVPTTELAGQITQVLRSLPDAIRPQTATLCGTGFEQPGEDGRPVFPDKVTVLIATPSALRRRASPRALMECRMVIVDEADMLLEGGFKADVDGILETLRPRVSRSKKNQEQVDTDRQYWAKLRQRWIDNQVDGDDQKVDPRLQATGRQFVFVGATYPDWVGTRVKSVVKYLEMRFPEAHYVKTQLLHRTNPNLTQDWIYYDSDVPGSDLEALKEALTPDKTIVFCNTVQRAVSVAGHLRNSEDTSSRVAELHKEIPASERASIINDFCAGGKSILVSTDLAARGLDFGPVLHIVQADFATNVTQYLHRIGRTARAGFLNESSPIACKASHLVSRQNADLPNKIRELSDGPQSGVVVEAFSRRRSFRRKLKKGLITSGSPLVGDTDAEDDKVSSSG